MDRKSWMITLAIPFGLWGCADEEPAPKAACGEPADAFVMNDGQTSHTCDHVVGGPFGDLDAAAVDASDPPLAENQHMFYTVMLPEDGGQHVGSITYRPPFAGTYRIHLSDDVPVEVTALDDGSATCNAANQSVDGCDGIDSAHFYTIEARRSYRIVLGPTDLAEVGMVIEEHIATQ